MPTSRLHPKEKCSVNSTVSVPYRIYHGTAEQPRGREQILFICGVSMADQGFEPLNSWITNITMNHRHPWRNNASNIMSSPCCSGCRFSLVMLRLEVRVHVRELCYAGAGLSKLL